MRLLRYSIRLLFLVLIVSSCGNSKNKSRTNKTHTTVKTTSNNTSGSTTSGTESSQSSNPKINKALDEAKSYIGTKYRYGGTDKKGVDCSGLMCAAYQSVGVELPRTSSEQSTIGKRVYIGELQPGDLVFFGDSPNSKKITHVGLISHVSSSSIRFIHASTRAGVVESELLSNWYKPRYIKAVRPLK